MPLSKETVSNKPLPGHELKKILMQDFEKLLANNGLLSNHIAYGRIGYEIRLTLHLDNFSKTVDVTKVPSRTFPADKQLNAPGLAAVEPLPLVEPSADAVVDATRLTRAITSPNQERIRAGIPVSVTRRDQSGTRVEEKISYPPDESLGEGNVGIENVSDEARAQWGWK